MLSLVSDNKEALEQAAQEAKQESLRLQMDKQSLRQDTREKQVNAAGKFGVQHRHC